MNLIKTLHDISFLIANPSLLKWIRHGLQIQPNIALRSKWLQTMKFDTIIDIGANVGQAAINLCSLFENTTVHSFEPIPSCFEQLKKVAKVYPNLKVYNFGLGNETVSLPFHQNSYTPSSSLLVMKPDHIKSYPKSAITNDITIQVKRLDDIASELKIGKSVLVKIDVQGFESQVIEGGIRTISQASVVIVETSIESMYEGDSSFETIFIMMRDLGFAYHGSFEQLIDSNTNRVLQQDAIFIKKQLGDD